MLAGLLFSTAGGALVVSIDSSFNQPLDDVIVGSGLTRLATEVRAAMGVVAVGTVAGVGGCNGCG